MRTYLKADDSATYNEHDIRHLVLVEGSRAVDYQLLFDGNGGQ